MWFSVCIILNMEQICSMSYNSVSWSLIGKPFHKTLRTKKKENKKRLPNPKMLEEDTDIKQPEEDFHWFNKQIDTWWTLPIHWELSRHLAILWTSLQVCLPSSSLICCRTLVISCPSSPAKLEELLYQTDLSDLFGQKFIHTLTLDLKQEPACVSFSVSVCVCYLWSCSSSYP